MSVGRWTSIYLLNECVELHMNRIKGGKQGQLMHSHYMNQFTPIFLDASSHLYKRVCPSVGPSVGLIDGFYIALPLCNQFAIIEGYKDFRLQHIVNHRLCSINGGIRSPRWSFVLRERDHFKYSLSIRNWIFSIHFFFL